MQGPSKYFLLGKHLQTQWPQAKDLQNSLSGSMSLPHSTQCSFIGRAFFILHPYPRLPLSFSEVVSPRKPDSLVLLWVIKGERLPANSTRFEEGFAQPCLHNALYSDWIRGEGCRFEVSLRVSHISRSEFEEVVDAIVKHSPLVSQISQVLSVRLEVRENRGAS